MPQSINTEEYTKRLNLAQRVREAISSLGRGAQTKIARRCRISPQSVTGWYKTGRIDKENLTVVANMTSYSLVWLMTGRGEKRKEQGSISYLQADRVESPMATYGVDKQQQKTKLIPLVSWLRAGEWCAANAPFPPGYADEWLSCPARCSAQSYALKVQGDSMTSPYPGQQSFTEGMVIYIDPERTVVNGSKVIATLLDSNQVTFKVYREDGGKKWLMPINPAYERIEFVEGMHICGVVIGAYIAV